MDKQKEFGKWMTVRQVMAYLKVSRWHVYNLARRYQWQSCKIGITRLYAECDVKNTPNAEQRKKMGYENRKSSTRVEQKETA